MLAPMEMSPAKMAWPEARWPERTPPAARWGPPMAPEPMWAEAMAALAIWAEPACFVRKPPVTLSKMRTYSATLVSFYPRLANS